LYTGGGLAGGVGLFLLGMWMMTEGLKLSAVQQGNKALQRLAGQLPEGPILGEEHQA